MQWIHNLKHVARREYEKSQERETFQQKHGQYSQYGEDGILKEIFRQIDTTNKYFVDFGAGDGYQLSNTRYFLNNGWRGLMMDGSYDNKDVKKEFITAENILELFAKYEVPKDFDLLSIDIDGQDYWVLEKILTEHKPRVIINEINGTIGPTEAKTVPFYPPFEHDGTDYYGASLAAFKKLLEANGYKLIYQHLCVNSFFILEELVPDKNYDFPLNYRARQYHRRDPQNREWTFV